MNWVFLQDNSVILKTDELCTGRHFGIAKGKGNQGCLL